MIPLLTFVCFILFGCVLYLLMADAHNAHRLDEVETTLEDIETFLTEDEPDYYAGWEVDYTSGAAEFYAWCDWVSGYLKQEGLR